MTARCRRRRRIRWNRLRRSCPLIPYPRWDRESRLKTQWSFDPSPNWIDGPSISNITIGQSREYLMYTWAPKLTGNRKARRAEKYRAKTSAYNMDVIKGDSEGFFWTGAPLAKKEMDKELAYLKDKYSIED